MSLDESWYTEVHTGAGSAFSLRVRQKLHDEQSPFQRVEVYDTEGFGRLMTLDGLVMVSDRDNFLYHEMLTHPVLYTHPKPERVLIIGGGDCGTLREVLKHPEVLEVTQVEIDAAVTRAAELWFPELVESNHDPRAQLHFADGVAWVRDAEAGRYDVILIDSTDPVGPAEGLFGESFLRDAWRALAPNGLLAQQSESPLYHLEHILLPMHRSMRHTGFVDTRTLHFPQCVYPSGWWTVTLASKDAAIGEPRTDAIARKPFGTRYYNAEIHRAAFALPEFVRQALATI